MSLYKEATNQEISIIDGSKVTLKYYKVSIFQFHYFYNLFGKATLINLKGKSYVDTLTFEEMQELTLKYMKELQEKTEAQRLGEMLTWFLSGDVNTYMHPLMRECFPELELDTITDEAVMSIMIFLLQEFTTIMNNNTDNK